MAFYDGSSLCVHFQNNLKRLPDKVIKLLNKPMFCYQETAQASFGKLASQLNVATQLHLELVGSGVKGCVGAQWLCLSG